MSLRIGLVLSVGFKLLCGVLYICSMYCESAFENDLAELQT